MVFVGAACGGEEPVLTAQGEEIAAEYTKMLEDLKKAIVSQVPKVDEKKKAELALLTHATPNRLAVHSGNMEAEENDDAE